jgi:hypothetical protein
MLAEPLALLHARPRAGNHIPAAAFLSRSERHRTRPRWASMPSRRSSGSTRCPMNAHRLSLPGTIAFTSLLVGVALPNQALACASEDRVALAQMGYTSEQIDAQCGSGGNPFVTPSMPAAQVRHGGRRLPPRRVRPGRRELLVPDRLRRCRSRRRKIAALSRAAGRRGAPRGAPGANPVLPGPRRRASRVSSTAAEASARPEPARGRRPVMLRCNTRTAPAGKPRDRHAGLHCCDAT